MSILVLRRKNDWSIATKLLIASAYLWFISELINLYKWDIDPEFIVQGILNKMVIMIPCSFIVLAEAIRKKSVGVETEPLQNEMVGVREEAIIQPTEIAQMTGRKIYTELDNKGMRVDTFPQSMAYWLVERLKNPRKDPFVYYVFQNEANARAAMTELPFMHVASDSKKLICDELFRYGYFAVTNNGALTGEYDAFVAGASFTHDMWKKTHAIFTKHNGVKKNDLEPEKVTVQSRASAGNAGNIVFVREDRDNNSVWRVHKAPCKADAMAFLSQQQVSRPLFYLIVETPEGNFGRDKDGFYQE
ncbi:MAG: hypothetical protein LBV74_11110 [Tannerella sp.]|nr:hypothetical protein [Tannerella sp.]